MKKMFVKTIRLTMFILGITTGIAHAQVRVYRTPSGTTVWETPTVFVERWTSPDGTRNAIVREKNTGKVTVIVEHPDGTREVNGVAQPSGNTVRTPASTPAQGNGGNHEGGGGHSGSGGGPNERGQGGIRDVDARGHGRFG